MAIESLWKRKNVEFLSPVLASILVPKSFKKLIALAPHDPAVSQATGTKWYLFSNSAYFLSFSFSASSAAAAPFKYVWLIFDAAKVSLQVKSHINERPLAHGQIESPSGRLPSALQRPVGSKMDGIPRSS